MSSSKKIDLSREFAAGVYLSEDQKHIPPLHIVYVYSVYLFTQGRGEQGELNRREIRGARVHKAGSKTPA